MYTHLVTTTGQILCSNLPTDLYVEYEKCSSEIESIKCGVRLKNKRQGKILTNEGVIYLCSYDSSLTHTAFRHQLKFARSLFKTIQNMRNEVIMSESDNVRRLEHNIVTYHKKMQEEIDEILPSEGTYNFRNWRETLDKITKHLTNDTDSTARSIMKIMKYLKFVKAETDVFDLLNGDESSLLQFQNHSIHKVINLTLQAYWLSLVDRRIIVTLDSCFESVYIDYPSISVVLGHIFDNAEKYAADNSEIKISFNKELEYLKIGIEMTSMLVEQKEIDKIFEERYSGEQATRFGVNGNGIGMYYCKLLTEMNNGSIDFIAGTEKYKLNGIPYADNIIILKLKIIK